MWAADRGSLGDHTPGHQDLVGADRARHGARALCIVVLRTVSDPEGSSTKEEHDECRRLPGLHGGLDVSPPCPITVDHDNVNRFNIAVTASWAPIGSSGGHRGPSSSRSTSDSHFPLPRASSPISAPRMWRPTKRARTGDSGKRGRATKQNTPPVPWRWSVLRDRCGKRTQGTHGYFDVDGDGLGHGPWYDATVKNTVRIFLVVLLAATMASAQSASSRAWQQRLELEIPLPVPLVELETINPFAVTVDETPAVLQSITPSKVDVQGVATVAAYIDAKGECLGAVPLELPVPGLTSSLVEDLTGTKFDPATAGNAPQPSWVVLEVVMDGKVKDASILDQFLEMPDPAIPPVPNEPVAMTPPGRLRNLKATPHDQLSTLAAPRRIKVNAPGRENEVHFRTMVHITEEGRCDRYVPLELYEGLSTWLSGYLATWKAQPATHNGVPVAAWVVFSARVQMKLSAFSSGNFRVVRDREYSPTQ